MITDPRQDHMLVGPELFMDGRLHVTTSNNLFIPNLIIPNLFTTFEFRETKPQQWRPPSAVFTVPAMN